MQIIEDKKIGLKPAYVSRNAMDYHKVNSSMKVPSFRHKHSSAKKRHNDNHRYVNSLLGVMMTNNY